MSWHPPWRSSSFPWHRPSAVRQASHHGASPAPAVRASGASRAAPPPCSRVLNHRRRYNTCDRLVWGLMGGGATRTSHRTPTQSRPKTPALQVRFLRPVLHLVIREGRLRPIRNHQTEPAFRGPDRRDRDQPRHERRTRDRGWAGGTQKCYGQQSEHRPSP